MKFWNLIKPDLQSIGISQAKLFGRVSYNTMHLYFWTLILQKKKEKKKDAYMTPLAQPRAWCKLITLDTFITPSCDVWLFLDL